MKRIILVILLVMIGSFAYGDSGVATVKVKARLVSEELVIDGIDNKPLIVDYGKNCKNGKLEFVVSYSGVKNTANSEAKVNFDLDSADVQLINEEAVATLDSNVKLSKNTETLKNKNSKVTGTIQGNIKGFNSEIAKGIYAGVTQLTVTVIPM